MHPGKSEAIGKVVVAIIWGMMAPAIISAQTVISGGNVSGTWEAYGSPYLIEGEITVLGSETLIIEPGVEVDFQGHYKLIVAGFLKAIGTEGDSILFTAADSVTGWRGIRFRDAPNGSQLSYCVIQYGRATGGNPDKKGGGIYCDNSNPVITNCTLMGNSAVRGGGIFCDSDSEPTIISCTISGNTASSHGGGIRCYHSAPTIESCIITGNSAGIDGGGISCYAHSNPNISNCTISGNSADCDGGGIFCNFISGSNLSRCIISGNSADGRGGGIFSYYSNMSIENCSISGNSADSEGGGIYIKDASADLKNTILEGNTGIGGIHFFGVNASYSSVSYSDFYNNENGNFTGVPPNGLGNIVTVNANGDPCDAFFNIFEDPLFIDPEDGDYHLQEGSPCIDAGDPDSPPDPDSTIADIGAYYYNQVVWVDNRYEPVQPSEIRLLQNFPNPFNMTTMLRFSLPRISRVKLTVHDLAGRKIAALVDGVHGAGTHEVIFDGSAMVSGVYLVRLQAGGSSQAQRLILLK